MTQNLFARAVSLPDLTANELQAMFRTLVVPFLLHAVLIGFAVMALVALVQMASTGFGLATKQLMPDVKRLNPMSRLKQMPKENLHNVLRSVILSSRHLVPLLNHQNADLRPEQSGFGEPVCRAIARGVTD